MIVETVFLSILKQMEFHLVQNWKENCHHDHIPFNLKGNGNLFLRAEFLLITAPEVFCPRQGRRFPFLFVSFSIFASFTIRRNSIVLTILIFGAKRIWNGLLNSIDLTIVDYNLKIVWFYKLQIMISLCVFTKHVYYIYIYTYILMYNKKSSI